MPDGIEVTEERGVPGGYAERRFRRGRRAWRKRVVRAVAVILLPFLGVVYAAAFWLDTTFWWWLAGLVLGSFVAAAKFLWDAPPEHLARWGLGALGERQTAHALRPLEREGRRVEHDRQLERGNIDHIVEGPAGVFLLETKALSGRIAIEDSVLTTVQRLDPDEVYRAAHLRGRVLARASDEAERRRDDRGRRPWVQAVVVVWGDFPQRAVEDDRLAYVHGDELAGWLRARPRRR